MVVLIIVLWCNKKLGIQVKLNKYAALFHVKHKRMAIGRWSSWNLRFTIAYIKNKDATPWALRGNILLDSTAARKLTENIDML